MGSIREIIKVNSIQLPKFILVLTVLFFNNTKAQNNNDSVFNSTAISKIQLQNVEANEKFSFNDKQNTRPLILFVFLSPECPLCQNYSGVLNNLYKQYNNHIQMYGIVPGKAYSNEEIKKFKQEHDIQFSLLIDYDKKLTSYLHAVVTPQVILLNNKYQLLYKGAIDDWAVSLGKQRVKTTQNFLHNALQQSLSNETLLIKRTKAVGCRINDY
jgi:peroxiredoxin